MQHLNPLEIKAINKSINSTIRYNKTSSTPRNRNNSFKKVNPADNSNFSSKKQVVFKDEIKSNTSITEESLRENDSPDVSILDPG